jgi:hypothetical protein
MPKVETERTMHAFEFLRFRRSVLAARAAKDIAARLARVLWRLGGGGSRPPLLRPEALSEWQLKDLGLDRSEVWHRAGGVSRRKTGRGHAED